MTEESDAGVSTIPGQGCPKVDPKGETTGQGGRGPGFLPFLETGS